MKWALIDKLQETVKAENWHGRLFTSHWKDEELSQDACFAWRKDWSSAPTHTVTGMIQLYEQLLPTKVYMLWFKFTLGLMFFELVQKNKRKLKIEPV